MPHTRMVAKHLEQQISDRTEAEAYALTAQPGGSHGRQRAAQMFAAIALLQLLISRPSTAHITGANPAATVLWAANNSSVSRGAREQRLSAAPWALCGSPAARLVHQGDTTDSRR